MSFFKEWKFGIITAVALLSIGYLALGPEFKKGMDVAGGVELTYQIDFSKYHASYPKEADYTTAIKNAKNIIKQNITARANSMGVGDTEVKLLTAGDKEYIVVKIGGKIGIDEAKAKIGKTVELEFKLPNTDKPTAEELAARQQVAEDVLKNVMSSTGQMKQLAENRQSEDIYYESLKKTRNQLPQVYQDNADQLMNLSGVANQVIKGKYGDQTDASGNIQTIQGFFVIKINGSSKVQATQISDEKLETIAKEFKIGTGTSFALNSPISGEKIGTGIILVGSDIVLADSLYDGSEAYRSSAYLVPNSGLIVNNVVIAQLTGSLLSGSKPESNSGYSLILDDQWIDLASLQSLETGLVINSGETIKLISSPQGTIVLNIKESKKTTDSLQRVRKITGSTSENRSNIVDRLTSDVVYDVEQIFIKDTASWKPAIESKFNRVLNGAYFKSATTTQSQAGATVVSIEFNKEGADIFCNLTAESIGKQMAIFVGGKKVTDPVIRSKICGGQAQIDGQFTDQTCTDPKNPTLTHQAKDTFEGAACLVSNLNEGALPAQLILSNESTLAATLGQDAWQKAGYATILGLVLVFALLLYMYGVELSVVAITSLGIYLIVLLALIKFTEYALSLSGIAAIILNIGMGVDSSILIFERLKEERQRGLKLIPAIITAYERSWAPIFDGNVSTGLIGLIMALVGSDIFQGFGFMMAINNVILLGFAVPFTKYLLLIWANRQKS